MLADVQCAEMVTFCKQHHATYVCMPVQSAHRNINVDNNDMLINTIVYFVINMPVGQGKLQKRVSMIVIVAAQCHYFTHNTLLSYYIINVSFTYAGVSVSHCLQYSEGAECVSCLPGYDLLTDNTCKHTYVPTGIQTPHDISYGSNSMINLYNFKLVLTLPDGCVWG